MKFIIVWDGCFVLNLYAVFFVRHFILISHSINDHALSFLFYRNGYSLQLNENCIINEARLD